ncbi:tetratricopeptide repeat protein [Hippea alviniae]|uniref:tetratricopeptide repeat protein n=1 Tax=Hippea alviniae TaxID=1279027 RepID=UPI0003B4D7A4|nr:tetratricopeptide repeat protein [Hippea alviniae]
MAEEEKDLKQDDEEVIVIEDEEEQQEEIEETQPEETEEGVEAEEEKEEKQLEEKPKKSKKTLLIGGIAAAVLVVALLLFFVFHKKSPQPKPKPPPKKEIVKKKPKKKKIELPKAYNPIVDVHFINAMRLQEKGKYKEAIQQLKQATVDLYVSYYGIAYIYLKMGDVEKAKEYLFDKTKDYLLLAIHNNPNYINGYVNLFRIYMALKDYKSAQNMIDELKRRKLDFKDIQLMQTYYDYVVDNKTDEVFKLLAEYPNSPLLLSLAGDYYLKQGNVKGALKYLKKAISLYPMGSVYYNLSLIETQNNQYKEALKKVPKMYYMDISKIPCKNYLAFFLLLRDNKFEAAEKFLNLNDKFYKACFEHFKIIPEVSSPLTVESYSIRQNLNFVMAAEILNMYLQPVSILPDKATPNLQLGAVYQSLGLPQKAADEFMKAAKFSEAVLLSQYASKFFLEGDYKKSLQYYKLALSRVPSNPILIYDAGVMSLKNHDVDGASEYFQRLISTYPLFPLPYLGMFVVKQVNGKHMDAMKYLNSFGQRVKSLDEESQEKLKDLSIFADYIIDKVNFNMDRIKKLNDYEKKVFLLFRAALNQDTDYLSIQKPFEESMHIYWDASSLETICNYLYNEYKNDFLRRTMATIYLLDNEPQKAYESMYNIKVYSAEDYYKLGVAYLLSGYPDIADNFFTKSILKGANFFNSYVAKAIIQAQKGSLTGIQYYLKIILKKKDKMAWFNTDLFLSYKIRLKQ